MIACFIYKKFTEGYKNYFRGYKLQEKYTGKIKYYIRYFQMKFSGRKYRLAEVFKMTKK